jgi:hypothetical protein
VGFTTPVSKTPAGIIVLQIYGIILEPTLKKLSWMRLFVEE